MQQNQKMRADANLHTPQVMDSQNTWLMYKYVHTNTRPNPEHIWLLFLQSLWVRFVHKPYKCIPNILFATGSPKKRIIVTIFSCSPKSVWLTFSQLTQKHKFFLPCSSSCLYKERKIKLSHATKMVHMQVCIIPILLKPYDSFVWDT